MEPSEQVAVEIVVRDLGRSSGFYRSLGFELLHADGTFVELAWDIGRLLLEQRPGPGAGTQPQANVQIMVADADAWWERAQRAGARVLRPISDRPYGLRDFTVLDPDGYRLRFAARLDAERVERHAAQRSIERRLERLGEAFGELGLDSSGRRVVEHDPHEVAQREDANGPAGIDDGQVAEAAVDHQHRGVLGRIRGLDRLRMTGHPLGDRFVRPVAGRNRPQHVTLGQDADQPPGCGPGFVGSPIAGRARALSFQHEHGADPAAVHRTSGLGERDRRLDRQQVTGHVL